MKEDDFSWFAKVSYGGGATGTAAMHLCISVIVADCEKHFRCDLGKCMECQRETHCERKWTPAEKEELRNILRLGI